MLLVKEEKTKWAFNKQKQRDAIIGRTTAFPSASSVPSVLLDVMFCGWSSPAQGSVGNGAQTIPIWWFDAGILADLHEPKLPSAPFFSSYTFLSWDFYLSHGTTRCFSSVPSTQRSVTAVNGRATCKQHRRVPRSPRCRTPSTDLMMNSLAFNAACNF
ncbi:hypothetical protein TcCL_NonESM03444 [Trypanosoma cruzi]|nr:hypothetical protein TcCL_NonESM03444 [Trypanosoma cruzi]